MLRRLIRHLLAPLVEAEVREQMADLKLELDRRDAVRANADRARDERISKLCREVGLALNVGDVLLADLAACEDDDDDGPPPGPWYRRRRRPS